jgi:hypothetical protein
MDQFDRDELKRLVEGAADLAEKAKQSQARSEASAHRLDYLVQWLAEQESRRKNPQEPAGH